jgi:large subunit ribosomal protein L23
VVEVKSIYTIIKAPVLTEKATILKDVNQYVFWVNKDSNKIEVKRAIEKLYKVKVKQVNVLTVKGKTKRIRWGQEGKTPAWKKAIVTLHKGHDIKIT